MGNLPKEMSVTLTEYILLWYHNSVFLGTIFSGPYFIQRLNIKYNNFLAKRDISPNEKNHSTGRFRLFCLKNE